MPARLTTARRRPLRARVEDLAGPCSSVRRAIHAERPAATAWMFLVQDEKIIRDLVIEHLAGKGHELEAAGTTSQARARIAAAPPNAYRSRPDAARPQRP